MAALTADRNTLSRSGVLFSYPAKSGVLFYVGAIAAIDTATGLITKGAESATLKGAGIVQEQVDNTAAADGAANVTIRRGQWLVANSAGADQLTLKDVGMPAYIVDDQTVAKTDGGGKRSVAGTVVDIDPGGVWIAF
ncbi:MULTISPECIES: hypothetical protein [Burkholderia]|uniref:hypothetical protein n=1 Tax=Burkholderia TaxID=32008 RepID=UPI00075A0993|nr:MULTISPECIES: hypothetical protein [Burkholderia]KUY93093.1 hypothetical protein WS48_01070 [Burkholderia sp. RF7-non_BP1]KUY98952.1 hypothetical protein WS49_01790 [Burkholderia sp. RF7-non_BP4]MBU9377373.1 hypothetical protein [Burkholderia multivorans]